MLCLTSAKDIKARNEYISLVECCLEEALLTIVPAPFLEHSPFD